MRGMVCEISAKMASDFLLPRHYSGRIPSISKAFGWFDGERVDPDRLMAVCTFGKPASNSLCVGICGGWYASNVYELNRLCRRDEWTEPLSQFVGCCLRRLRVMDWIVVSYSDEAMNHHGYIYQACNFLYTGATKQRTDMYVPGGKHSRHYKAKDQGRFRVVRSAKHRYVYFCTMKKWLKKEWMLVDDSPLSTVYHLPFNGESLLTVDYLEKYGNKKRLWGWHISEYKWYREPKSLADFGLKRPPQSWCYVDEITLCKGCVHFSEESIVLPTGEHIGVCKMNDSERFCTCSCEKGVKRENT